MLIDTIDTYGFSVIDQSFIQKIQEDQIHVPTKEPGQIIWDIGAGLVNGACSPVKVVGHLMGLALHNPHETIKVSASLNIDAVMALNTCIKSINKRIRGATLTLLSWGVPESQLKDQLSHWSEQDFTEARAFAKESRERLQSFTDNPIVQGVRAFGSSMMAGAHEIANSSYNILYGLCCMEAACEQNDIQLCELGEKIVTENLLVPSVYEASHFVGEMLTLQYGPSVARKFAGICHTGKLRKLVRSLAKRSAAVAAEKELLVCAATAASENTVGKAVAKTVVSGAESKWIFNGKKFGLQEYKAAKLADNSFKIGNVNKKFISDAVIPKLQQRCELWGKKFVEFMDANPQALQLLAKKVKKKSVKNHFDWFHMFVPELKRGGVSGYHLIDYVPEGIAKIVKEYAKSIDIIAGVENTIERLFTSPKTLFLPGTTEQEVIQLFHDTCMNLDKWAELSGGSIVVRSTKISGQWYEIIVDKSGSIKTFYPTNQLWNH